MAPQSSQTAKPAGTTLATVIAELQFIQQFHVDNPKDTARLAQLLDAAKQDLLAAARALLQHDQADDPIIDKQA